MTSTEIKVGRLVLERWEKQVCRLACQSLNAGNAADTDGEEGHLTSLALQAVGLRLHELLDEMTVHLKKE